MFGMMYAPAKGPTQFIPLMIGIPLLFLGVVGLNPHRRRISTWITLTFAIAGLMYGLGRSLQMIGNDHPMAIIDERIGLAMAVFCGVYVAGAGYAQFQRWRSTPAQG